VKTTCLGGAIQSEPTPAASLIDVAYVFQFLRVENTRRNFFLTHGKIHSDVINSEAGKKASPLRCAGSKFTSITILYHSKLGKNSKDFQKN
jgi:hypothetical protein